MKMAFSDYLGFFLGFCKLELLYNWFNFFASRFALRECHIFMEKSSEAVAHILVSEGRKATQLTQSKKVTFFKKQIF